MGEMIARCQITVLFDLKISDHRGWIRYGAYQGNVYPKRCWACKSGSTDTTAQEHRCIHAMEKEIGLMGSVPSKHDS